jgi:hypothetical protein
VVLQVNHRDHDDALTVEQVASELNPFGFPVVESVANEGTGVKSTHEEARAAVEARLRDHLAGNEGVISLAALHEPHTPSDDEVVAGHVRAIQERSEAAASATIDELTERQIEHLPDGPTIEVPFQPREFVGSQPSRVLEVNVHRDEVHVDLVMERMGGGTPRRLTVRLVNRPTDTPALARAVPAVVTTNEPSPETDRVFDYLPDSVDITHPGPVNAPEADMPPLAYGVVGLGGGVVIGGLLSYLVGVMG